MKVFFDKETTLFEFIYIFIQLFDKTRRFL